MGTLEDPRKKCIADPDAPTIRYENRNGKRIKYIEYPTIHYKNHPNKPNNTEPRHPNDPPARGVKITWAQRMEFKKRAEDRRAAAEDARILKNLLED